MSFTASAQFFWPRSGLGRCLLYAIHLILLSSAYLDVAGDREIAQRSERYVFQLSSVDLHLDSQPFSWLHRASTADTVAFETRREIDRTDSCAIDPLTIRKEPGPLTSADALVQGSRDGCLVQGSFWDCSGHTIVASPCWLAKGIWARAKLDEVARYSGR